MYYNLQYGLLDIKDEHIPNNGIGAFWQIWMKWCSMFSGSGASIMLAHSIMKDFIKLLNF